MARNGDSRYGLKVELTGRADRLDMGCEGERERDREVKEDSKSAA